MTDPQASEQERGYRQQGEAIAQAIADAERRGFERGRDAAARTVAAIGEQNHRAFHHAPRKSDGSCGEFFCQPYEEAVKAIMSNPEPGRVYWFAEVDPIESPARYLVRGAPGVPAHLTTDPLKAARFETRDECLHASLLNAVRVLIPERLVPREHMFMGPPSALEPDAEGGEG